MAKEIPYFKFYPTDWSSGDITLENYELQGIFINVASYYWSKECDLTLFNLKKRFRGFDAQIDELITNRIIKLNGENIIISFLDEQLSSKELQNAVNKMNGRKGGRPKAQKTEEKPNGLNFDNRTETQTEPIDKEKDKENNKYAQKALNILYAFEDFWQLYPNKKDKKKAELKWNKISESDKEKIKNTLSLFIEDIPFKGYNHPYATTYLNGQRWNDYEEKQKEEINSTQGDSLKDQMNAVRTY